MQITFDVQATIKRERDDEINVDLEFFSLLFFGSRKAGSKRVRKLAAWRELVFILLMY